jgi:hypothetical protein
MIAKPHCYLALICCVLFTFEHLLACSCDFSPPPHIEYERVDVVFSGRVRATSIEGYILRATFEVSESWKGINEGLITVHTASSSDACGYSFGQGSRYLVYAYFNHYQGFPYYPEGCVRTNICTRTRLITAASTDIQFLDYLESSKKYPEIRLSHGYPNPINPDLDLYSTIYYSTTKRGRVTLTVYDLSGREAVRLVDGYLEEGHYEVIWPGKDQFEKQLPSGIYIARLVTPEYTESIKMVLVK